MKRIEEIQRGKKAIKTFDTEEELQAHIEANWDKTPFYAEWVINEKLLKVGNAGQLDILAKHKTDNRWLVIELKKDATADQTVGQTLRYMGWVKKHIVDENGVVEGVIVSGYPPDDIIKYALSVVPSIGHHLYRVYQGKIEFMDYSDYEMMQKYNNLNL